MRKILLSSALGLLPLLFASAASAQTVPAFDINRFNPSERGSEWFSLDTLDFRGGIRPALGITPEWAFKPLAVPTGPTTHATPVENQFTVHFGGSLVLGDTFRFGINIPMVMYQNGDSGVLGSQVFHSPDSTRLADSRISLDVRVYGKYRDPITVALGGQLYFPTGSRNLYTGDEQSHGIVHVLASGERGMWVYSASLGFHVRALHTTYANERIGDEIMFSVAGGVHLLDRALIVGPEIYGSRETSTPGDLFPGSATPIEIILGGHYTFAQDFKAGLGAGPGFGTAYGSPDFRLLSSIEWAPHYEPPPPEMADRDHDGVADERDTCPDEPGFATPDVRTNGCKPTDTDRDGVPDQWDVCPAEAGTPSPDGRVNGCKPKDSDKDGVLDMFDACPDKPGMGAPDVRSNGCDPRDSDGDGIPDHVDACPTKPGPKTNDPKTNGCPEPDRDKDGIANEVDACPDEPGKADPDPKKNGCPKAFVKEGKIEITEQVKFKTGSAALEGDKTTQEVLEAVQKVLGSHTEIKKIRIEGHTDNQGVPADNKTLSNNRAATVMNWLAAHGVDKSRMSATGFGQEKPIADNATADGRKINRRVEFHIE